MLKRGTLHQGFDLDETQGSVCPRASEPRGAHVMAAEKMRPRSWRHRLVPEPFKGWQENGLNVKFRGLHCARPGVDFHPGRHEPLHVLGRFDDAVAPLREPVRGLCRMEPGRIVRLCSGRDRRVSLGSREYTYGGPPSGVGGRQLRFLRLGGAGWGQLSRCCQRW